MIADRRSPGSVTVVWFVKILEGKAVIYVAEDAPVYEIPGMQDGNSGHRVEARSDHVEIGSDPDHVRVGIVRIKNGG
jgi:hypothetical protein